MSVWDDVVGQVRDLHHLAVAEVEHVANAAKDVVVDHGARRRRGALV